MVDKKTGVKPKRKVTSRQSSVSSKNKKDDAKKAEQETNDSRLETTDAKTSVAKAGKRSAKAAKEAEDLEAKQARKAKVVAGEAEAKPKPKQKPPRSKLERAGKKFRDVAKLVEKGRVYELAEAVELAIKTSPVKFDASVEMHFNLNVDPKLADQNVRDVVNLPAGSGKTVRVAVFADETDIKKAKAAGADMAGSDDLLAKLDKSEIAFDILLTTPAMMPQLGKYAKLLGPKGLMPNPKRGTITTDITAGVKAAKAGKVEYRVDQAGIVHLAIGKVSFGKDKLVANAEAVIKSLKAAKPASVKGAYISSVYLTTSMGPSIRLALS